MLVLFRYPALRQFSRKFLKNHSIFSDYLQRKALLTSKHTKLICLLLYSYSEKNRFHVPLMRKYLKSRSNCMCLCVEIDFFSISTCHKYEQRVSSIAKRINGYPTVMNKESTEKYVFSVESMSMNLILVTTNGLGSTRI